jgi:hypothetical protein
MKRFLLFTFLITSLFVRSQCSITASTTPETCAGSCDASVTFSLSSSCTAFPYNMVISGTCTPNGTFVVTSSATTFTGLCSCASINSVILYNSLNFPVAFTNFSTFGGPPITVFTNSASASCSSCCNGSLNAFVTGGTSPYTYTWTGPATSANTPSITNLCPGVYTLCVMDSKGCTTCNTYTLGFSTGIAQNVSGTLKMMDTEEEFIFISPDLISSVTVYDITGRKILQPNGTNTNEIRLNKNDFQRGTYIVNIETAKAVFRRKILVN